jgi:hypothetical protein
MGGKATAGAAEAIVLVDSSPTQCMAELRFPTRREALNRSRMSGLLFYARSPGIQNGLPVAKSGNDEP